MTNTVQTMRHAFATLLGFIALTAISAHAKSLEEAARDLAASFGHSGVSKAS